MKSEKELRTQMEQNCALDKMSDKRNSVMILLANPGKIHVC